MRSSDGASWLHVLEFYKCFQTFKCVDAIILFAAAQVLYLVPSARLLVLCCLFSPHLIAWCWSNNFVFRSKAWKALFQKIRLGLLLFLIAFWLNNLYLPVTWNDSPAVRKTVFKILHPSDWASTVCSTLPLCVLQGELVTASKAIIEKEYQPKVIVSKQGPNPFNKLTDQELDEYRKEVEQKQKGTEGNCDDFRKS